jgi:hypothetical protein
MTSCCMICMATNVRPDPGQENWNCRLTMKQIENIVLLEQELGVSRHSQSSGHPTRGWFEVRLICFRQSDLDKPHEIIETTFSDIGRLAQRTVLERPPPSPLIYNLMASCTLVCCVEGTTNSTQEAALVWSRAGQGKARGDRTHQHSALIS